MQHIGVDIIEIARIKGALEQWGESFRNRIYTERELEMYRQISSLAARFAAKEAVMKALDAPSFGIGYREIEILSDKNGKPFITLYGKAQVRAKALGLSSMAISLSHCREYAVAMVTGESDDQSIPG